MKKPETELPQETQDKLARLKQILKGYNRLVLAFSGGVDSAFLLAVAAASGAEQVVAVTIASQFFTGRERRRAAGFAERLGVDHVCVETDILSRPDVVKNDAERCYFCKRHSFSAIRDIAEQKGISILVHGINTDDLGDYRPGIRAAGELGFRAPLVEAGFSKAEIRACSKAIGLETWDLPSQSCLATRIPLGDPISADALAMVEKGENLLHDLGIGQARVRCHGSLARIEVPGDVIPQLTDPSVRERICTELRRIGFTFVALDLEGYASGKMNVGVDKKPPRNSVTGRRGA